MCERSDILQKRSNQERGKGVERDGYNQTDNKSALN